MSCSQALQRQMLMRELKLLTKEANEELRLALLLDVLERVEGEKA